MTHSKLSYTGLWLYLNKLLQKARIIKFILKHSIQLYAVFYCKFIFKEGLIMMYLYICKDNNGEFFATYGNFKKPFIKPCDVYPISNKPATHWNLSPFGYVSNISSDIPLKKIGFKVVYQYNYDDIKKYRHYYAIINEQHTQKITPFIDGMRLFKCYERGMCTLDWVLKKIAL